MATDFIHSYEVTSRLVDIIEQQSPADWTSNLGTDIPLRTVQHGDLRDHVIADPSQVVPCVLVRSLSVQPTDRSGIGGVRETEDMIRIVMIRRFADCTDSAGDIEQNMVIARQRYAKELVAAVFSDPHKRLALISDEGVRTALTLTCTDSSGAQVIDTEFMGLDYEGSTQDVSTIRDTNTDMWAIALDVKVRIRTGGQ